MGELPPIGTRWGSLSRAQRRALPVGTVLRLPGHDHGRSVLTRGKRRWTYPDGTAAYVAVINNNRVIYSYSEPTP